MLVKDVCMRTKEKEKRKRMLNPKFRRKVPSGWGWRGRAHRGPLSYWKDSISYDGCWVSSIVIILYA